MAKPHTYVRAENFRRTIRNWMLAKRLSLKDAAQLSGVDYRLLQRWVSKGISRPGLFTRPELEKLLTAMGLGVWWLRTIFTEQGPSIPFHTTSVDRDWPKKLVMLSQQADAVLHFGDPENFQLLCHVIEETHTKTVARMREDPDPEEAEYLRRLDAQQPKKKTRPPR